MAAVAEIMPKRPDVAAMVEVAPKRPGAVVTDEVASNSRQRSTTGRSPMPRKASIFAVLVMTRPMLGIGWCKN
jgi:hypothetical protein